MPLTTYSDILTLTSDWLARSDITPLVPNFMRIVESRLNRELRVKEMVSRLQDENTLDLFILPTNFIEAVYFKIGDSDYPLEYRPIEEIESMPDEGGDGKYFSVLGTSFRIYPTPTPPYTYDLVYYRTIPSLEASTNGTNWLLTKAPEAYLFGCAAEGAKYLMDENRAAYWESQFQAVVKSLQASDARARRTSSPRRARVVV